MTVVGINLFLRNLIQRFSFLTEKHEYLAKFHRKTALWWAGLHLVFYFGCTSFGMKEDASARLLAAVLIGLNRFVIPKNGKPNLWQTTFIEISLVYNLPIFFTYSATINQFSTYWMASIVFGAVFYALGAYPAIAATAFPLISLGMLGAEGFDLFSLEMQQIIAVILMSWVLIIALLVIRHEQQVKAIELRELHHDQLRNQQIIEQQIIREREAAENIKLLRWHLEIFQTFVAPSVRQELANGLDPRSVPVREVHWAILYTDVMGYTKASKTLLPLTLSDFVNEFFDGIIRGVFYNMNGEVDKLMGDAVMAVFATPDRALDAYLKMKEFIGEINTQRIDKDQLPYRHGIGISFGPMAYGNFGNSLKQDRTVVGSVVNDAQRIEKLCRDYEVDALVTEAFIQNLNEPFAHARPIDFTSVGESEPMIVYELFGHDPEELRLFKSKSRPYLERAIQSKKQGFDREFHFEISTWIAETESSPGAEDDRFFQMMKSRYQAIQRVI